MYWIFYVIIGVIGVIIFLFFPSIANSSFFVASVTYVAGSFALFIYTKQNSDEKSNAATTILLEIRNAESKTGIINDIIDKTNQMELPTVLPVNSWRTYSHLFIKNFDLDDIQLINTFYSSCEIIEDLAKRQNNWFWITTEERAKTVQSILAKIHDDFQIDIIIKDQNAQNKFEARKNALTQFYSNENLSYAPQKTLNGLKFQIHNLKFVTSTPCGEKLKKLANLKK